ncbi:hypothetical protein [Synechococcus sp. CCY 0621]|uniref:hypothetical protein n=1 Tax=Synechococcus sp. CCY 0621 TaxID=2815603 RepID=UPI001C216F85|nr:hypothetical protein [Synechococcus sp. CCY 0621]
MKIPTSPGRGERGEVSTSTHQPTGTAPVRAYAQHQPPHQRKRRPGKKGSRLAEARRLGAEPVRLRPSGSEAESVLCDVLGITDFPTAAESHARLAALSPKQNTEALAGTWLRVALTGLAREDTTGQSALALLGMGTGKARERALLRRVFDQLAVIPHEGVTAFCAIQTLCRNRLHTRIDWSMLRRGLVLILHRPELQRELRTYGLGRSSEAIFGVLRGAFNTLPDLIVATRLHTEMPAAEMALISCELTHLECSLEASADIAAGRVLHDAGELVLHHRSGGGKRRPELCLSFRHSDGVLSFLPDVRGSRRLSPSTVRSMRKFVRSYQGPAISGDLAAHSQSQHLCHLVGLEVRNGRGYLLRQHQESQS